MYKCITISYQCNNKCGTININNMLNKIEKVFSELLSETEKTILAYVIIMSSARKVFPRVHPVASCTVDFEFIGSNPGILCVCGMFH